MSDSARTGALSTPAHDVSRKSLASIGNIETEVDGFAMRAEVVLRRVAICCAVFMLFGPLGGRTMWVAKNGSYSADAMGYNMAALFSGIVAIAALAFAFWARPRVILALLGIIAALAAFGLSVLACGVYVWARLQGEVWMYAIGGFAGKPGRNETLHYAPGPPFFALAALVGAMATLGLAVVWLRTPKSK